ncbi:helix-turn-helix domain-containing protein [Streptomyces atratus]|uniref:helix-turn-helix domain-containing protein n=1 Tax=Streptomyces atratus TaxID=1893 RepID=UPI0036547746
MVRARIIAPSWDGLRVAGIAAELGCHAKTVRWWLHRFNMLGVEGRKTGRWPAVRAGSPRRNGRGSSGWPSRTRRGV